MSVNRTAPAEQAGTSKQVSRNERVTEREFIGRAWNNIVKNEESKYKGVSYINITLDQDVNDVTIMRGNRLQLWPNQKREGKQDADYRVSLIKETVQSNEV